jgi:hypothetical protein
MSIRVNVYTIMTVMFTCVIHIYVLAMAYRTDVDMHIYAHAQWGPRQHSIDILHLRTKFQRPHKNVYAQLRNRDTEREREMY